MPAEARALMAIERGRSGPEDAHSRQKFLNRVGDNSVSRTVCWILRWPRYACSALVSWPRLASAAAAMRLRNPSVAR